MRLSRHFWRAFWAGMAAPLGLYAVPAPYPVHEGMGSVGRSFAQVGQQLSRAAATVMDEAKPKMHD